MSYLLGWCSALLMGVSKTGLPGLSIPSVMLMTKAFGKEETDLAIVAMVPILLVGDVFAVVWYHHHAQWDRLWRLFPYVAAGMVPGAIVYYVASENALLGPVIGVLVLALLALEICRRKFAWQHVPHQKWFVAAIGLLAGFATIIAHAAFPVMTIYMLSQDMVKKEFLGTAAWFFLVLNLSKIPIYATMHFATDRTLATWETIQFDLFVAPVALLGALLGVYVLKYIPQKFFDAFALVLAGYAAIELILW